MTVSSPRNEADMVMLAAGIQLGYEAQTKMRQLTNTKFEGEVTKRNSKVKVLTLDAVTVSSYDGTDIDLEEVDVSPTYLTCDQAEYINVGVDALDSISGAGDWLQAAANSGAMQVAKAYDRFIASTWFADAGITSSTLGTIASPVNLPSASDFYDYLVDAVAEIEDEGPELFAVVDSTCYAKLKKDDNFVGYGLEARKNGLVGEAAGLTIIRANVIAPASGKHSVLFTTDRNAVSSAYGLVRTRAYEPEKRFSDAIKSLFVYGADVTQPARVGKGAVTFTP